MDYKKHYDLLINRARNRTSTGYVEKHHIVPRCLGGSDEVNNIVELYPEEHFLAHQLLVKMHPTNCKLVHAAVMMCVKSPTHTRVNNKIYSWLRVRLSESLKASQSGPGNSQFGTCWISNLDTKESKKIPKELLGIYLDSGWIKARIINWDNAVTRKHCPVCSKEFISKQNTCSVRCGKQLYNKLNPIPFGKGQLESIVENYKNGSSIYKCLVDAGLDGTGNNHNRLKNILRDLNLIGDKSIGADTGL